MKNRLLSIDVFRGFTVMFMVIVNSPGSWAYVYSPLLHAKWHGCTPTDLVFPFFIFAIGLSLAFSQANNQSESFPLLKKIFLRSMLIFLVGFLLNWFPFYHKNLFDVRLFGVLQRIGMSYFLAGGLVVLIQKRTTLAISILTLLFGYWGLTSLLGDYSLEGNLNNKIDQFLFSSNNLYGGFGIKFDPEGLLGTIPSSAHILVGYLVGKQLFEMRKTPILFIKKGVAFGLLLLVIGIVWGLVYPINKPLWTSSYVLYTAGIGTLSLTLLVYLIDIRKITKWVFPFQVIGINPLISFVLSIVVVKILLRVNIEGKSAYGFIYSQLYQPLFGNYNGSLLFALTNALIVFGFAYWLYKRNRVIKL